eukprot:scaffold101022_cov51-Phaeocystis_antarctica.AAC.1
MAIAEGAKGQPPARAFGAANSHRRRLWRTGSSDGLTPVAVTGLEVAHVERAARELADDPVRLLELLGHRAEAAVPVVGGAWQLHLEGLARKHAVRHSDREAAGLLALDRDGVARYNSVRAHHVHGGRSVDCWARPKQARGAFGVGYARVGGAPRRPRTCPDGV